MWPVFLVSLNDEMFFFFNATCLFSSRNCDLHSHGAFDHFDQSRVLSLHEKSDFFFCIHTDDPDAS